MDDFGRILSPKHGVQHASRLKKDEKDESELETLMIIHIRGKQFPSLTPAANADSS